MEVVGGCDDGGSGCHGGDERGVAHVMESGEVDLVDRGGRSIFGVRWKSSPEKSFGGGG
nr:hypothetical protein [Tanacetum cinerariifolium]